MTGFGVVDLHLRGASCVDYGVLRLPLGAPLPDRLQALAEGVHEIVARYRPHTLVVESAFLGPNVRSLAVIGQVRGAAIAAARMDGVEVVEYGPREVKLAVVGTGRASKQQVQYMVRAALRLPVLPTPFDAADGLALALCHAHRRAHVAGAFLALR